MKKPYQIESQRAVNSLEEMATESNPAVQTMLPLGELRNDGRRSETAGGRAQPAHAGAHRESLGERARYCVVMGQKVPVERPRVRSSEDREIRLGSYEMLHRGEPLTETVWEKLMLGLSEHEYGEAVREFTEAYGLEKSAVSEHFIEAGRTKGKDQMEKRLHKKKFCAVLIDAAPFEARQMVAVLDITVDGSKMIFGIRHGAKENATVMGELVSDLMSRWPDFTAPPG